MQSSERKQVCYQWVKLPDQTEEDIRIINKLMYAKLKTHCILYGTPYIMGEVQLINEAEQTYSVCAINEV